MYEKPRLITVGKAESVILGIVFGGDDPDGHDFPISFEFSDDSLKTAVHE
jgi:hypothetical protein